MEKPEMKPEEDRKKKIDIKIQMILKEIIDSEKKYVKTLTTIVEKLVEPAISRGDLFSPFEISELFGNIEELTALHSTFYFDLQKCPEGDVRELMKLVQRHLPTMSAAYSRYCSNFPTATSKYNKIVTDSQSKSTKAAFFRRCSSRSPDSDPGDPFKTRRRLRRGIGSISSINVLWDDSDDAGEYRRLKEEPHFATVSRRHSVYSGGDSSDDSGISDSDPSSVPRRFSNYFSKKRSNSRKELSVSRLFFAQDQFSFLNICLADSDLDGALPILAYLLEPVQRVMRYPLLLKNLKFSLLRCDSLQRKELIESVLQDQFENKTEKI